MSLHKLFYPEKIAIVGVSEEATNLGKNIVQNLLHFGFKGKVYPIGRQGGTIFGLKIYNSLLEIKDSIDLITILTPAHSVPTYLRDAAKLGISYAYVGSGGFGEYDEGRLKLEEEIRSIIKEHNIRLVGPNCLGIINLENGLVLPFVTFEKLLKGDIAIVSQSGGVGLQYLNELMKINKGISKFISMGNKLDLDEVDYVEYLLEDPNTSMIILYLESLNKGRKLYELINKSLKPVLIYKANRTKATQNIAMSHTEAMSYDYRTFKSVMGKSGAILFETIKEMELAVKGISLPPLEGNNIVVVSRSGGHAVIATDLLHEYGFELPNISEPIREEVKKHLRASVIKIQNPLDLGDVWNLESHINILEKILEQKEVDGVVYLLGYLKGVDNLSIEKLLLGVERIVFKYRKPIVSVPIMIGSNLEDINSLISIPLYTTIEDAIKSLNINREFYHSLKRKKRNETVNLQIPTHQFGSITIVEEMLDPALAGLFVSEAIRIPIPEYVVFDLRRDEEFPKIGFSPPYVVKLTGPSILHKSDIGGVITDIKSVEEVESVINSIKGNKEMLSLVERVIVQKQYLKPSCELLVGIKNDPCFEAIVIVGEGGVLTELRDDISIDITPLTLEKAIHLLDELKIGKLLRGYRGVDMPPIEMLGEIVVKISYIPYIFPKVSQFEINPLFCYKDKIVGVDPKAIFTKDKEE